MQRLTFITAIAMAALVACSEETTPDRNFEDGGGGTTASDGGGGDMVGTGGTAGSMMTTGGNGSGGSGNDGGTTSTGGSCVNDAYESNDTFETAHALTPINDCDSNMMGFSAVLDGDDVDWFKYDGSDDAGCSVDPTRTISADGQVMLCKFFSCLTGDTEVTCDIGNPATSNGLDGCCSQSAVQASLNCTGTLSDDATVYLRIEKPSGFDCVSYNINLHY